MTIEEQNSWRWELLSSAIHVTQELFVHHFLSHKTHPLPMLCEEDLRRSMSCHELHVRVSGLLPRENIV